MPRFGHDILLDDADDADDAAPCFDLGDYKARCPARSLQFTRFGVDIQLDGEGPPRFASTLVSTRRDVALQQRICRAKHEGQLRLLPSSRHVVT